MSIKIKVFPYSTPEKELNDFLASVKLAPQNGIGFRDNGICLVYTENRAPGMTKDEHLKVLKDELAEIEVVIVGAQLDHDIAKARFIPAMTETVSLGEQKKSKDFKALPYNERKEIERKAKLAEKIGREAETQMLMSADTIAMKTAEANAYKDIIAQIEKGDYKIGE